MIEGKKKPLLSAAYEWRKGVWRRWLVSHVLFGDSRDSTPPDSGVAPARAAEAVPPRASAAPKRDFAGDDAEFVNDADLRDVAEPYDRPSATNFAPSRGSQNRDSGRPTMPLEEPRRDARARIDALTDRFLTLEDALDTLSRRVAVRDHQQRQIETRTLELLERVIIAAERQSELLESSARGLERMERRLERIEQSFQRASLGKSADGSNGGEATSRFARAAVRDEPREARESRRREQEPGRHTRPSGHPASVPPGYSPSIHGDLADMSLATILAMFELERRTGRLMVTTDLDDSICFLLSEGRIGPCDVGGRNTPPLQALRRAMDWQKGEFWFEPGSVESKGPLQAIGTLLLEASRQSDEDARTG